MMDERQFRLLLGMLEAIRLAIQVPDPLHVNTDNEGRGLSVPYQTESDTLAESVLSENNEYLRKLKDWHNYIRTAQHRL